MRPLLRKVIWVRIIQSILGENTLRLKEQVERVSHELQTQH